MTTYTRDLPALEKRRDRELSQLIDAYYERIQADNKKREIEHHQRLAEIYAKRDAAIAAIRAARKATS